MRVMSFALSLMTVTAALPAVATAQPAAPVPPPASQPASLDAFLEQRVVEELVADGIILSRLGVTLDIEVIGDRLLISLMESATGRAAASTKIDVIPADREAAVASVTQVVADLTTQLSTARPPAAEPEPAKGVVLDGRAERDDDHDDGDDREAREYEFRQRAIGFGSELVVTGNAHSFSVHKRWIAHRGELQDPLAGPNFYEEIGRPDLASAYQRRRKIMWGAGIAGAVMSLAGAYVIIAKGFPDDERCQDLTCRERNAKRFDDASVYRTTGLVTMLAAAVPLSVSMYLWIRPQPISEGEARNLAAEYNRSLRLEMGLPVGSARAPARPLVSELALTPHATAGGGGLTLLGRF